MVDKRVNSFLRSGFTLVELLIVMFLMVLLLGIGAMSVARNNNNQGLNTAVTTMEGLIYQARATAMGGKAARLCINDDTEDNDNFRRQIVILEDTSDADSDTPEWNAISRAVYLPSGIYIDDELTIPNSDELGVFGTDGSVPFTRKQSSAALYLEFNSLGICKDGNDNIPGATVGIIEGVVAGGQLILKDQKKAALVVWRNGTSSRVNDINSIQ